MKFTKSSGGNTLMKRALALLFVLVMVCALVVPAYATEGGSVEGETILPTPAAEETVAPTKEPAESPAVESDAPTEQPTQEPVPTEAAQETNESAYTHTYKFVVDDEENPVATVTVKSGETLAAPEGYDEYDWYLEDAEEAFDFSEALTFEDNAEIVLYAGPKTGTDTNENDVNAIALTAANTYTVEVGAKVTIKGTSSWGETHGWSSDNTAVATVSYNGRTATVTGKSAGTATITHTHGYFTKNTETFTVTVTPVTGTVTVYVYVSSSGFSDEMYELLKIDKSTLDGNGYFPAGSIQVPKSFFVGKSTTPGDGLISNANDWNTLLSSLSGMDTTLTASAQPTAGTGTVVDYTKNNGNNVGTYLSQAVIAYGSGWGSQSTALFHWHNNATWGSSNQHYGFTDQSVKYHLDLKFDTRTINFITGNNNITTPDYAKDGTVVDSRTYITNSTIQEPRNLKIPDGYQFMGYYKDAEFTEKWDGIGTKLSANQTVYIKITEKENIVLNYVVASGEGTVEPDQNAFNPDTGTPVGSTATPAENYQFDGWYSDAECKNLVSTELKFVPTKPESGWVNGTTYYAKFSVAKTSLTVSKTVTGKLGDMSKEFEFKVSYTDTTGASQTATLNLASGKSATVENIKVGSVITVTETDPNPASSTNKYYTTYSVNGATAVEGYTATITSAAADGNNTVAFVNNKDYNPDTGVSLDSLPYVIVLTLAIAGSAAFIIRRRKSSES